MPYIENYMNIKGALVTEAGSRGLLYRQVFTKGETFPLGIVYNDVAPGGNTKNHSHDGFHVTFVVQGSGQLHSGVSIHEINEGDVIYLTPFEPHCFFNTGDTVMVLFGVQG